MALSDLIIKYEDSHSATTDYMDDIIQKAEELNEAIIKALKRIDLNAGDIELSDEAEWMINDIYAILNKAFM